MNALCKSMHYSNVMRRKIASMTDDELKQHAAAHPASKLAKEEMTRRAQKEAVSA